MNRKLTLSVDDAVVRQAKLYAERHNETLSGMVDKYFRHLVAKDPHAAAAAKRRPRDFERLIGIVRLPAELDVKHAYREARARKATHE